MRAYDINNTFFEIIDTENKAYVLGLLYADGYVNDRGFRLELMEQDKDVVYKIQHALESKRPIRYTADRSDEKRTRRPTFTLEIKNKKMAHDLRDKGCIQKKSKILTFPLCVDPYYINHFVRGYFDGDGCFSDGRISILGTRDFLLPLQNILVKSAGVESSGVYFIKRSNIWTLNIQNEQDVSDFIFWIYSDCAIYGDRKYNKAVDYFHANWGLLWPHGR